MPDSPPVPPEQSVQHCEFCHENRDEEPLRSTCPGLPAPECGHCNLLVEALRFVKYRLVKPWATPEERVIGERVDAALKITGGG